MQTKTLILTFCCLLLCKTASFGTAYTDGLAEWNAATTGQGTNLAAQRPITFSTTPNYPLTATTSTGANDTTDLTNNTLSGPAYCGNHGDLIWCDPTVVGWSYTPGNISLIANLGSPQNIGRVAIRACGGLPPEGGISYPKQFKVLVSNDGVNYYRVACMVKLSQAESSQANNVTTYYYAEDQQTAYVHTFVFDINVQAQYVAVKVTPTNDSFFTDELSIFQAAGSVSSSWNIPANKEPVVSSGVGIFPKKGDLTISSNIVTPNWFTLEDARPTGSALSDVKMVLEIPSSISVSYLMHAATVQLTSSSLGGTPAMTRWVITPQANSSSFYGPMIQGPFYFTISTSTPIEGLTGTVYTIRASNNNLPENQATFTLHSQYINPVPALSAIDNGTGWMMEAEANDWPSFFTNAKQLGFNQFPTFPRWYYTNSNSFPMVATARANGFKIAYISSPYAAMLAAAKTNGWSEVFNQVNGAAGNYMSPLYRGTHYTDEHNTLAAQVAQTKPDFIYLDIEFWWDAIRESLNDPAMQSAIQTASNSGLTQDQFFQSIGATTLQDLRTAIASALNSVGVTTMPPVGLYANEPVTPVFQYVYNWSQLYPQKLNFAMPSLYTGGNISQVHDSIRSNYQLLNDRNIIPWLSAGTCGEFDSKLVAPMLLETILNGARGFVYFCPEDFDPMDYYYHAQALNLLAPYQNLLSTGALTASYTGTPSSLLYTCYQTANEALVLVNNYQSSQSVVSTLSSPLTNPQTILDLSTGVPLPASGTLALTIPPQGFKLLYFSKRAGNHSSAALEAYWNFQDTTTGLDISGKNHTATLQGGATQSGGTLNLTATTSFATTPSTTALKYQGNGGAITLNAWVYINPTETTSGYILSKPWNSNGQYNYRLLLNTNRTITFFLGAYYLTTTQTLSSNTGYNLTATADDTTGQMKIYINGVIAASGSYNSQTATWTPSQGDANTALVIGSLFPYSTSWTGNAGFTLDGKVDNVGVYTRALPATELARSEGLAGIWKFEETTTATADSTGNGNTGALINTTTSSVTRASGHLGTALNLNGLSYYVEIPATPALEYTGGELTLSVWVYLNSTETNGGYVLSKAWDGAGHYNYGIGIGSDRRPYFNLGVPSITAPVQLNTDTWYHIAATADATGAMKIYVNGALSVSNANGFNPATITWIPSTGNLKRPLCLGTYAAFGSNWSGKAYYFLDGKIDEVSIYNRTLSAAEIATLSGL